MRRGLGHGIGVALAVAALAGCAGTSNQALDDSLAALDARGATTTAPSTTPQTPPPCNVRASLRPTASLPAPGAMPPGSYMAQIRQRGRLVVGVDQNTLKFAYFNPLDGRLEGFEIDLARALAQAISGNPTDVRFVALTTAQRLPAVQNGTVDVVIDAVTITCERRQEVDFSSVYYDAVQRLLVPIGSKIATVADLAGKRVCATKGSTELDGLISEQPKAIRFPVASRTDCLVALQQGTADAITSDDSILLGFKAQDPYTKLVGPPISPQPYGMAISKAHPDFVRFVNGVLAKLFANGGWRQTYAKWLGGLVKTIPAPPTPQYSG